jgi:hypothetical protein
MMTIAAFAAIGCLSGGVSASAQASTVPVVDSESVSNITSTDATLQASINSQADAAGDYYQFQLVRNASGFASEILCPPTLPPGTDGCFGTQSASALPIGFIPGNTLQPGVDHPISLDLAGAGVTLQPGTTYHYRVLVARRVQTEDTIQWEPPTVYGADQTFTTPSGPPSIESESVSHVTSTDATLEAQINPQGDQAGDYYQFQMVEDPSEYASEILCPTKPPPTTDGCIGTHSEGALPIGWVCGSCEREQAAQQVQLDLANAGVTLKPATTYHYRVIAARAVQTEDTIQWEPPTVYGPDQTFATPPASSAPVIDSVSISHLTSTDATLEAQVNTEGLETSYEFRLTYTRCRECEDIVYRIPLPSGLLLGSFETQSVSLDLNSARVTLKPGFYEYSLSATSTGGSTEARWQAFEPPEDMLQAVTTTTSPGSQLTTEPVPNIGNSTIAPGATGPAKTVTPPPRARTLTNAQKLAKALKLCAKKPTKRRATCKKQAHKKYGTTALKAKKR